MKQKSIGRQLFDIILVFLGVFLWGYGLWYLGEENEKENSKQAKEFSNYCLQNKGYFGTDELLNYCIKDKKKFYSIQQLDLYFKTGYYEN